MPCVHSFNVMAPSAQLSTHYYSPWGPKWQRTQTTGTEAEQKLNTERSGEHRSVLILQEEEQPPFLKWARVCCLTPLLSNQSIHTSLAFTPSQLSAETSGKAAASNRALGKKHECSELTISHRRQEHPVLSSTNRSGFCWLAARLLKKRRVTGISGVLWTESSSSYAALHHVLAAAPEEPWR